MLRSWLADNNRREEIIRGFIATANAPDRGALNAFPTEAIPNDLAYAIKAYSPTNTQAGRVWKF